LASMPPSSSPTSCFPSLPWALTSSSSPTRAHASSPPSAPPPRPAPCAPTERKICYTSPTPSKKSPPTSVRLVLTETSSASSASAARPSPSPAT
jgi:hypothetical protein